jgi:hypothetical protein
VFDAKSILTTQNRFQVKPGFVASTLKQIDFVVLLDDSYRFLLYSRIALNNSHQQAKQRNFQASSFFHLITCNST